jgi:hypothetical protein
VEGQASVEVLGFGVTVLMVGAAWFHLDMW